MWTPRLPRTPRAKDSSSEHTWASLLDENPWAKTTKLVAKPDQLIKSGGARPVLVYVNKTISEVQAWVDN